MQLSPTYRRFARYSIIGASTFLLDLAMLYVAVSIIGIPYYVATPCSFLIAVSCNYFWSRHFVFHGSERSLHAGYAYFIMVALSGAATTTMLVAGLVSFVGIYYIFARIIVAGVIGMANYLFNLHINFNVAGKHDSKL
ncbi:MAG TPA: GtrA family protein [Candidatus Paceibacterota bacterium]|nr:GtrA family protein [Candidatus Paceibacterota bacterium]